MLPFSYSDKLKQILKKLQRKDKSKYERLLDKVKEICNSGDIEHYKNLRKPLQHLKRSQIGEMVLIFIYDKKEKLVSFENFKHHDRIYK